MELSEGDDDQRDETVPDAPCAPEAVVAPRNSGGKPLNSDDNIDEAPEQKQDAVPAADMKQESLKSEPLARGRTAMEVDSIYLAKGKPTSSNPFDEEDNTKNEFESENSSGVNCGRTAAAGPTAKRKSLNPFDEDFDVAAAGAAASVGSAAAPPSVAAARRGSDTSKASAGATAATGDVAGASSSLGAARSSNLAADFVSYGNISATGNRDVDGLVEYGFCKQKAWTMLQKHQNDAAKAFGALCDVVKDIELNHGGKEMQTVWTTPITARLVSWLPGVDKSSGSSGSTTYVISVTHHYTNKVWKVERSYEEFSALNSELRPHIATAFPDGMHYPFPTEWIIAYWFGINDEIRQDRMERINNWLREIYLNPLMALQTNVRKWLVVFLKISENVLPPNATTAADASSSANKRK